MPPTAEANQAHPQGFGPRGLLGAVVAVVVIAVVANTLSAFATIIERWLSR